MGVLTVLIVMAMAGNALGASNSSFCGSPLVSSRIVGGTNAMDGEWPWQVAIQDQESDGLYLCGGSLIAPQWVMTAAHCIHKPIVTSNYKVYLGMYQLNVVSSHTVVANVKTIIPNSQYVAAGGLGDIALIQLATPVTYTEYIMPICLPSSTTTFPCGMDCWVTGWGTRSYGANVVAQGILQEVMVPLIDRNACQKMYNSGGSNDTILSDNICAGYENGQEDSCQGDSGGALVCEVQGVWYQVGIVSWGEACASPDFPGVYTLVTSFQNWISTYLQVTFYDVTDIPTPTGTCGGSLSPTDVSQRSEGSSITFNLSRHRWMILVLIVLLISLFS